MEVFSLEGDNTEVFSLENKIPQVYDLKGNDNLHPSSPKPPSDQVHSETSSTMKSSNSTSHSMKENSIQKDETSAKQQEPATSTKDTGSNNKYNVSPKDTDDFYENTPVASANQTAATFLANLVARYVFETKSYQKVKARYSAAKRRSEYRSGANKYYYASREYINSNKTITQVKKNKIQDVPPPKCIYSAPYVPNNEESDADDVSLIKNQKKKLVKPSTMGNVTIYDFRKHYASRHVKHKLPRRANLEQPSLFMGKDQSYPSALNGLMTPLYCALCDGRLNSIKNANCHYESRSHDRHITAWLKKTYTDNGLDAPELRRFVTEVSTEASGEYRCELCKVYLTSSQHALQHFNGKRHRHAMCKISPLTGIGYIDMEGKWVQTGNVIDKDTGKETNYILVKTPTGLEPVALYVAPNRKQGSKKAPDLEKEEKSKKMKTEEPPEKKAHLEEELNQLMNSADYENASKLKKKEEDRCKSTLSRDQLNPTVTAEKPDIPESTAYNQFQTMPNHSKESSVTTCIENDQEETLPTNPDLTTINQNQTLLHSKGSPLLQCIANDPQEAELQHPTIIVENQNIYESTTDNQYQTLSPFSKESTQTPYIANAPQEMVSKNPITTMDKIDIARTTTNDQYETILLYSQESQLTQDQNMPLSKECPPMPCITSATQITITEQCEISESTSINQYQQTIQMQSTTSAPQETVPTIPIITREQAQPMEYIVCPPQRPVQQNPLITKREYSIHKSATSSKYQPMSLHLHEFSSTLQTPQHAIESQQCQICGITTTSKDQMLVHLQGARHSKKLKALGEVPISVLLSTTPATILQSLDNNDPLDISMYRTPSGSYYCKLCNYNLLEITGMKRHILGKKHLKAVKQHMATQLRS